MQVKYVEVTMTVSSISSRLIITELKCLKEP